MIRYALAAAAAVVACAPASAVVYSFSANAVGQSNLNVGGAGFDTGAPVTLLTGDTLELNIAISPGLRVPATTQLFGSLSGGPQTDAVRSFAIGYELLDTDFGGFSPSGTINASGQFTSGYFFTINRTAPGSEFNLDGIRLSYTLISGDPVTFNTRLGVTLAAVPEPATWVMMISGFGLVGAGLRRRAKQDTYALQSAS